MHLRKNFIFATFFFIFLFSASVVFASTRTQVDWPISPLTGVALSGDSQLHEFIAYLYGWGIMVGVIITFVMIVFGGITYMTSAGNATKTREAVTRITTSLLGFLFLLSSWLILNTINPQITRLRPLPDLWDSDSFSEIGVVDDDLLEGPPCAFALFYSEKDFSGSSERFSPGKYSVSGRNLGYNSGKGFSEMNEIETGLYEGGQIVDREVVDGKYIESPSCLITIYYDASRIFFLTDERQMGTFSLPNKDFSETMWMEEEAITFEIK